MQLRNQRGGIRPGRVAESNDSGKFQRRWRTHRDGQNAEALCLEFARRPGCIGSRLRKAGNRGKGPFDHAHRGAARIGGGRLRHLRPRIERNELDQFRQIGGHVFGGGGADGPVYRILPAVGTGQGSQSQHVRLVEAGHGMDGGYRQFILRQRAGLIGAQHVDAGRFIHGGEPRRKDAQMRQSPRAERGRKGKGSRQRYRDRRQNRREHQGNDLAQRQFESVGIRHQDHDDEAIYDGEIAHHAQNGLLLRTFDVRGANQLRRASKLCARSGRRNLRNRFTAPHQRPRISFEPGAGFDGNGFAGEHGLVEQHRSLSQTHIGRNHGAERQLHHIARHQAGSGHGGPDTIAADRRVQREPRLQRGKSRLSAPFLEKPESRVEGQENRDDRSLDVLAEDNFQHDRSLEHPWNRRPELGQRPAPVDRSPCRELRLGPNFSSRRRASSPVRPVAGGTSLAEAIIQTLLRQQLADGFQFPPAFGGGLGIGHLQFPERIQDDLGNNQPGILLVVGGNNVPGRVMGAGRAQASLICLPCTASSISSREYPRG